MPLVNRLHHARDQPGVVRLVGVHGDDHVAVASQLRCQSQAIADGGAQALILGMPHQHKRHGGLA